MIVEQTVLHPMKNMCTKFQANLFVTSRDILTSALHMSKNALLRKSRKNVMVCTQAHHYTLVLEKGGL